MKYIRTKDEIIDIDNFINKKENYSIRSIKGTDEEKARFVYFMKCGIKQADTIEELGDTYVIVPKDRKCKPYTVDFLSVFDDIKDVLEFSDIYLSIWVDALLKPVAQLNDKGDLELL